MMSALAQAVRRFWNGFDSRGVAAVEFAIIAPVLFALVLGVLAWGQFFMAEVAVSAAAQEGARASVAGLNSTESSTLALAAANSVMTNYSPFLSISAVTATAAAAGTSAPASALFSVTVTYNMSSVSTSLVPVPTAFPSSTVTVSISTGGY